MPEFPNCVAIDTETTGLNPWRGDRMFSAAMAFPDGKRLFWYRDFDKKFRRILEDSTIDKVFQNAKFDIRMLRFSGYKVEGRCWDTMIFAHLLDGRASQRGELNLDTLVRKYLPAGLQKVTAEVEDWFKTNKIPKTRRNFADLPRDLCRRRVIGDADLTLRLFHRFFHTVASTFPLLLEQEHRLLPQVLRMEDRGITIDLPGIEVQQEEFTNLIEEAHEFCCGIVGHDDFNLNSHDQQKDLLERAGILDQIFTNCTYCGGRNKKCESCRTPKGKPKLSAINLLSLHHPVAHMLLMGKTATKMRDTFLAQMLEHNVDGVLHPNYNQVGTHTGRFSCSKPNLQNLPIEGGHRLTGTQEELAEVFDMTGQIHRPKIRSLYLVRPGYVHIHADKEKAELAMLAHYSEDPTLMKIIREGLDVHSEVAKMIFDNYDENSKALRRRTKDMVFGVVYGAGDNKLASRTGGNVRQAREMKKKMMAMIPGLQRWIKSMERDIVMQGYILTDHGRRHYLYAYEAYKSVAGMCQGTVGDEVKSRMVVVGEHLEKNGMGTPLLNSHDEIAFEVPIEAAVEAVRDIQRLMNETGIEYRVPLRSSIDITCTSWGDMHTVNAVDPNFLTVGDEGKKEQPVPLTEWLSHEQAAIAR